MNDMSDYNYFLLISKKKISLEVLNSKNHIFFKTKIWLFMPLFEIGQFESVTGNEWGERDRKGSAKDLGHNG